MLSVHVFQGGRHIDYVVDQIVAKLIEVVKKKNKAGVSVKPFQVSLCSILNWRWFHRTCVLKLIGISAIDAPGEEPHLGLCERADWEPLLWLPDQGEYDTPDKKLWFQVPFVRQIHPGCKDTSYFPSVSLCVSLGFSM